jgi:hypothetical protein
VFDPVFLATVVDEHVAVAEVDEPSGGDVGVLARRAAVDDDLGVEIGKQARG